MCRTIFSHPDRVMSRSMDYLQTLQGTHTHGRRRVQIKHEERRRDGDKCVGCESCYSIGNGSHGVFSNAIVEVSSAIISCDPAGCLQVGLHRISVLTGFIGLMPDSSETYMLEVDFAFPRHVDGRRQVRSTDHKALDLLCQWIDD